MDQEASTARWKKLTWVIDPDLLSELEEHQCLLADGFDAALVGITYGSNPVAVYEVSLCIQVLIDGGMDLEEAWEWFSYNVAGSYVGEKTPCFVDLYGCSRD